MSKCAGCGQTKEAGSRWVAPKREVPLSGILNVDKPPGMTSHDVVNAVRRMAGQRKVGHAGTLDPMATGVLLVCLGQATRVAEYLMAGRKRYRATVVLGMTTTTYDAEGDMVSRGGRVAFERVEIAAALDQFVGDIEQVPPIYSAIKRDGQPLYKLARQGQKLDLPPRSVVIDSIELLDWSSPSLTIEVACSPGTYIRSLAHDVGQFLGSGAYLASLVRLASGRSTLEQAVSLERLEEAFRHGQELDYLSPPDEALLDHPAILLDAVEARRVAHGQSVRRDPLKVSGDGDPLCRAYSLEGEFVAIMIYHAETGAWRPKKVFSAA
jgi:tRNA pseudouridine55 synthase